MLCIYSFSGWLKACPPCAVVAQADLKSEGRPDLVDSQVAETI